MFVKLLCAILLFSIAHSLKTLFISTCCKSVINFVPGFLDERTKIPHIKASNSTRYTFANLPDWVKAEGTSLIATPPVNTTGNFTITVSYTANKT